MADVKLIGTDEIASGMAALRNYFILCKFQCISSGQLKSINIYFYGNTLAKAAIYSDNSGSPDALLAVAGETSCVSGFNNLNLISPINIVEDTYYWLAFNYGSSVNYARGDAGTGTVRVKSATYSTFVFPNPAGAGFSTGDRIICIYGAGSVAGGFALIGSGPIGSGPLIQPVLIRG